MPAEVHRALNAAHAGHPLWRTPALRRVVTVTVLGFSNFCLLLGAVPAWAHTGGAGEATAGLVTTVLLGCTVAAQGAVPGLLRRFGTGAVLAAGLVALGAPAPLYATSAQLAVLLPVSAVRGFGFAVLTVVGVTATAAVSPPERRGEAVGLYGLAIAVPNLVGVPAGVALTQVGWFRVVALLAAAPLLAIPAALALGRVADTADTVGGQQARRPVPGAAGWPTAARVATPCLVLLAVTLAAGALVTFLPIIRPAGVIAPAALLLFGTSAALCRWRIGVLVDRTGHGWLLPATLLAAIAGMAVVALGLPAGTNSAVVLVGALLFGAGYGSVQNLTLLDALARAGASRTATASAAWNAAFDAGTALGAAAVGIIAEAGAGLPAALALTALGMTLALPLAARSRRTATR